MTNWQVPLEGNQVWLYCLTWITGMSQELQLYDSIETMKEVHMMA
jgi:hypothetical protein